MYITDIKNDFYGSVVGKRCVILVNFDLDAICACKILQTLFRCDSIIYSIVPIRGVSDLKKAYDENSAEVNCFILINCGGTIDILEVLEPEENVIFYIIDSHRPIDVCNIYSNKQICVLGDPVDDVPEFDDIFRDDSEEENEEDSDTAENSETEDIDDDPGESIAAKRQRMHQQRIIKRREKRVWEEKRDKLMFEYSQFSFYGKSSALLAFELAWVLSKDSMDALWWAIVGVTEQMLSHKIENGEYVLACHNLQGHVSRLMYAANDRNVINNLKITFEQDLRLALYRHWTVEASMRYTMYTSCKLKLWTLRGETRYHELLADMGLPLTQSRQNFNAMDLEFRKEFHDSVQKFAGKYGLDNIIYGSFTLQYGYRIKYNASDFVYAMLGVLESIGNDKKPEDCFLDAMDFLSSFKKGKLEVGIEKSKKTLSTIFKQVQYSLDMRLIYVAGPVIYMEIQEGTLDSNIFSYPHCLLMLAHFALKAFVAVSKSRRTSTLPLICTAPMDIHSESTNKICLMVGIPPIAEDSPKNFFGKAFEKAASTSNSTLESDYFDSSVVRVLSKDRTKFLDALISLLS